MPGAPLIDTAPYWLAALLAAPLAVWAALRLRSRPLQNLSLGAAALLAAAGMLELSLLAGVFDWNQSWNPPAAVRGDKRINAQHYRRASEHPEHFNDRAFEFTKPPGRSRIAVLGDSFVFGHGVPYEEIWSVKLRALIEARYPAVELLNWGKNGWSTVHQFAFLADRGVRYDPDLLIFAFTTNDPDLGRTEQRYPEWHRRPAAAWAERVFPYSFAFVTALVNRAVERVSSGLGYERWEESLYSQENLAAYAAVLEALSRYAGEHGMELLFVLTPNHHGEYFRRRFDQVLPLLRAAGIPALDLHPGIAERFGGTPWHTLKANRANGHPGPMLTQHFAEAVFAHLEGSGTLRRLSDPPEPQKRQVNSP